MRCFFLSWVGLAAGSSLDSRRELKENSIPFNFANWDGRENGVREADSADLENRIHPVGIEPPKREKFPPELVATLMSLYEGHKDTPARFYRELESIFVSEGKAPPLSSLQAKNWYHKYKIKAARRDEILKNWIEDFTQQHSTARAADMIGPLNDFLRSARKDAISFEELSRRVGELYISDEDWSLLFQDLTDSSQNMPNGSQSYTNDSVPEATSGNTMNNDLTSSLHELGEESVEEPRDDWMLADSLQAFSYDGEDVNEEEYPEISDFPQFLTNEGIPQAGHPGFSRANLQKAADENEDLAEEKQMDTVESGLTEGASDKESRWWEPFQHEVDQIFEMRKIATILHDLVKLLKLVLGSHISPLLALRKINFCLRYHGRPEVSYDRIYYHLMKTKKHTKIQDETSVSLLEDFFGSHPSKKAADAFEYLKSEFPASTLSKGQVRNWLNNRKRAYGHRL
jgi:hypothetical protein